MHSIPYREENIYVGDDNLVGLCLSLYEYGFANWILGFKCTKLKLLDPFENSQQERIFLVIWLLINFKKLKNKKENLEFNNKKVPYFQVV